MHHLICHHRRHPQGLHLNGGLTQAPGLGKDPRYGKDAGRGKDPGLCQRGVAAVEFALVLVVLLAIASGIVEFGRAAWYYNALVKATRDGARQLSVTPTETVASAGISQAKTIVTTAALAARIPDFDASQVQAECLDGAFASVGCQDGVAPAYVRVHIVGYGVVLGGWMALFAPGGPASGKTIALGPHTTMRYLP